MPNQLSADANPDNGLPSEEEIQKLKDVFIREMNESDAFITETYHPAWDNQSDRYYGVRERNENVPEWCANMTVNLGFGLPQSDAGQNISMLYQPNNFFVYDPVNEKSVVTCMALTKLARKHFAQMKFYTNHFWGTIDAGRFGTGWMKWGWLWDELESVDLRAEGGKIKQSTKRKKISRPYVESRGPKDIIFDKNAKSMDKVRFIVDRYFIDIEEIEGNTKVFNRKGEVKDFLDAVKAMDPESMFKQVLVHEYWSRKWVCLITENGFMLRFQKNYLGKIPFRPIIKFTDPRNPLGIGIIEASSDVIDATDEMMNAVFDNTLLGIHRNYTYTGELPDSELNLYPGGVTRLNAGQKLEELPRQPIGFDWVNVTNSLSSMLNRVIGNVDQVEDKGVKTATEARVIYNRQSGQKQTFADLNKENYLMWALEIYVDFIRANMKPEDIVKEIGEQDGKKYGINAKNIDLDNFEYSIRITADNQLEDRMVAIENASTAIDILGKVVTLKSTAAQMGMDLKLNYDILIKHLVSKFELPDGVYNDDEQGAKPNGGKGAPSIDEEIAVVAGKSGLTPEQFLQKVMQETQLTPEQLNAAIQQAGSFTEFLKQMAQKEAQVGA